MSKLFVPPDQSLGLLTKSIYNTIMDYARPSIMIDGNKYTEDERLAISWALSNYTELLFSFHGHIGGRTEDHIRRHWHNGKVVASIPPPGIPLQNDTDVRFEDFTALVVRPMPLPEYDDHTDYDQLCHRQRTSISLKRCWRYHTDCLYKMLLKDDERLYWLINGTHRDE